MSATNKLTALFCGAAKQKLIFCICACSVISSMFFFCTHDYGAKTKRPSPAHHA